MKQKTGKKKRKKSRSYVLVNPRGKDAEAKKVYAMVRDLVSEQHEDLRQATIGVAWCTTWTPDADGRMKLAAAKIAGDLDRELQAFDVVVILNQNFWRNREVSDAQRTAVMDHGLSQVLLRFDRNGEPVEDEKGRKVYRRRKFDIQEFTGVIKRHGIYTKDLETFARVISKQALLFEQSTPKTTTPTPAATRGGNGSAKTSPEPAA